MSQAPVMKSTMGQLDHRDTALKPRCPLLMQLLIMTSVYYLMGRLSLLLAIPPGYATGVWPPAGIALAGMLLCGFRVWPGIVLGSVLVNLWTSLNTASVGLLLVSTGPALSIGIGAALQALVGTFLVRRYVGFPSAFDRDRDIGFFLILGGPISCLVSATIGVTALAVGGVIPWGTTLVHWGTWWIGDTIGVLAMTPIILPWSAAPRPNWRRRRATVTVPLVILLALLMIFFAYMQAREHDRLNLTFRQQVGTLAHGIARSFASFPDILYTIRSFYASSDVIDQHEFHAFVQSLQPNRPGLLALQWAPRVSDRQRPAYEEAARQKGYTDFQITEPGPQGQMIRAAQRAEYFPVYYVEPSMGNETVSGFDLASEAARLDALKQARDTGEPVVTPHMPLIHETSRRSDVLICLPIYHGGLSHATVQERRQNLRGFALGVYRLDDMLEATLRFFNLHGIELWIIDTSAPEGERLISGLPQAASAHSYSGFLPAVEQRPIWLHWSTTVELAEWRWKLHFVPRLEYFAVQHTWHHWAVRLGGLLLTGLFAAFLLLIASRTTHIERLVAKRTIALQRVNTQLQVEIAERQRAEEALTEREARTRAILDTAVDGLITIDEHGIVESCNPAAERMFGYVATEVLGQRIGMLMPAPYREEHTDSLARYLRTGVPNIIGVGREVSGQRKDGSVFPIEVSVSEIHVAGRRLFIGNVRDLTARQRTQEELACTNAELRRSNQELEQFAYVASHDLKAPLRGISQLAEWIEEDVMDVLQPDTRHKMALLQSRVRRLERLLNDLLQYSRVGRAIETVKCVDMRALVMDIVALLAPPEGFTVTVAETLPIFETAEEPLRHVLLNLMDNAIKHHDRPYGRIAVESQDHGAFYAFLIADDGPGIPSPVQGKVFQIFQTLKPRDEVEGSGIGLAIVKKIIERQGGTIQVESDDARRGTTIRFTWYKQWPERQV